MVSKYYEYATWILGTIVIILAMLLFRAQNASLDDNLDMAIENLRECNADLAVWRAENPTPSASTADQQKELSEILSKCAGSTGAVDPSAPELGPEAGSIKQ
jgi:hypothetical protein